jgi:mono/diheme cytochrome c family protein
MAFDARTGTLLWQFQTGSGIIGSPITYELDGTQYLAVPSGGIGGDMIFYYTEPKAGNLWVFALDGGGPARVPEGTNLITLKGGLPRVGEPGHTLGGRVLAGYGFPATEGGEPIKGAGPPQPTAASLTPQASGAAASPATDTGANPLLGQAEAMARGEQAYRARCVGCHRSGGASGPNLFRSKLPAAKFRDTVVKGHEGTAMPSFGTLLSVQEIWEIHAFVMSRDRL